MNKCVAVIAVSLPVIAVLGVLVDSVLQGTPMADNKIGLPEAAQLPSWIEEPLPNAPLVSESEVVAPISLGLPSARAAEAQMRTEMRAAVEADFQRLIGVGLYQRQQEAHDTSLRYQQDPNWPRIPALPGVSGFEIQDCTDYGICVSDRLAKEADDPKWARPMESKVFEVIARVTTDPVNQLHVVCREETCGVLIPGSSDQHSLTRYARLMHMGERLSEDLGLPFATVAVRRDFEAIYLTNGEIGRTGIFTQ